MGSEPLGPQQRVGQVKQQAERDEAGERIIEDHGRSPLKPFAGVGVADAHREEAEPEGQHENVQHEMLLCGVTCGARANRLSPLQGGEVPPGA